jgi:hypothetical protein
VILFQWFSKAEVVQIVEPGAATLNHSSERAQIASSATHEELCKFPTKNDNRYINLQEQIEALVDEAHVAALRQRGGGFGNPPAPLGRSDYFQGL